MARIKEVWPGPSGHDLGRVVMRHAGVDRLAALNAAIALVGSWFWRWPW